MLQPSINNHSRLMEKKDTDKAAKNCFHLNFSRRRFLKGIGVGAGVAVTEGLLQQTQAQVDAGETQQIETSPSVRQTYDSINDIWGKRTPHFSEWSVRVDERTIDEPERWVQSACVLCAYGCGMDIGVKKGKIVGVRGRGSDRVNQGRLGPKGLHGWEANHSGDRLTQPLIRQNSQLQRATWDEAMDLIVRHSKEIRDKYTEYDQNLMY